MKKMSKLSQVWRRYLSVNIKNQSNNNRMNESNVKISNNNGFGYNSMNNNSLNRSQLNFSFLWNLSNIMIKCNNIYSSEYFGLINDVDYGFKWQLKLNKPTKDNILNLQLELINLPNDIEYITGSLKIKCDLHNQSYLLYWMDNKIQKSKLIKIYPKDNINDNNNNNNNDSNDDSIILNQLLCDINITQIHDKQYNPIQMQEWLQNKLMDTDHNEIQFAKLPDINPKLIAKCIDPNNIDKWFHNNNTNNDINNNDSCNAIMKANNHDK